MKKKSLTLLLATTVASSILFSSCIGSFGLTNKLLTWNRSIDSKFVNELVFIAFWIVPVYEISALADVLVINSIEFWTGSNPMADNVKHIKGENGNYLVESNQNGYVITDEATQEKVELTYNSEENSWAVEGVTFMTFVDDNHVSVYAGEGEMVTIEKSEAGLMAYKAMARAYMACK